MFIVVVGASVIGASVIGGLFLVWPSTRINLVQFIEF